MAISVNVRLNKSVSKHQILVLCYDKAKQPNDIIMISFCVIAASD